MTTRTLRIFGFGCIAAAALCAQQSSVAGPSSGFVFDGPARALRTIRGIPGASLIGDPVNFGFDLAAAYISPRLDLAVVVAADGGAIHMFRLNSGTVAERPINGLAATPEHVEFSPSGTALAVYAAGRVQVVTGLPDAPVLAGTLELRADREAQSQASSLGRRRRSPAGSLAISDDGAYVLFAAGNSIQLLSTAGVNRRLMHVSGDALVAFVAGGHDAAVADLTGLILFRDIGVSEQRSLVAPPGDDIASSGGLAFSPDGRRLFLASPAARSVAAFDLAAGTRSAIACDCAPAGLTPMGNLFRLNELGTEPLWLLDLGTGAPRIVFVPAVLPLTAN